MWAGHHPIRNTPVSANFLQHLLVAGSSLLLSHTSYTSIFERYRPDRSTTFCSPIQDYPTERRITFKSHSVSIRVTFAVSSTCNQIRWLIDTCHWAWKNSAGHTRRTTTHVNFSLWWSQGRGLGLGFVHIFVLVSTYFIVLIILSFNFQFSVS